MTEGLKSRLKLLAEYHGHSIRRFEEICQLGRANIANMKEDGALGSDKISKIIEAFPDTSCEWLLTGKGDMIKTKSEDQPISTTHVDELIHVIQTQAATLLEQQRFINDHFGQEGIGRATPPHKGVKSAEN